MFLFISTCKVDVDILKAKHTMQNPQTSSGCRRNIKPTEVLEEEYVNKQNINQQIFHAGV